MAEVVSTERPNKIAMLEKDYQVRELRYADKEDDEYLRQYMLFYYQYEKTQGFNIDWGQFDYLMPIYSLDNASSISGDKRTNAELIRENTLLAIDKHNESEGKMLEFVEHIEANYKWAGCIHYWLTFRARDMSSPYPESKIYQAQVSRFGKDYRLPMFRLKPTDQEIDAIQVQPPPPMYYQYDKPPIVFARPGPEDDVLPGARFVFDRTGAGYGLYADSLPDD